MPELIDPRQLPIPEVFHLDRSRWDEESSQIDYFCSPNGAWADKLTSELLTLSRFLGDAAVTAQEIWPYVKEGKVTWEGVSSYAWDRTWHVSEAYPSHVGNGLGIIPVSRGVYASIVRFAQVRKDGIRVLFPDPWEMDELFGPDRHLDEYSRPYARDFPGYLKTVLRYADVVGGSGVRKSNGLLDEWKYQVVLAHPNSPDTRQPIDARSIPELDWDTAWEVTD